MNDIKMMHMRTIDADNAIKEIRNMKLFGPEASIDIYKPYHDYMEAIKQGEASGEIRYENEKPTDFDLAVNFAVGKLYEIGYETQTTDMIFHMMKALTDIDFSEE